MSYLDRGGVRIGYECFGGDGSGGESGTALSKAPAGERHRAPWWTWEVLGSYSSRQK
jgi:hypothetical protein